MCGNSGNLCFCREPSIIHDVMMETTDETKTKEAVIGLSSIAGELETNYKMMARRLDLLEDGIADLREGIKKLSEKLGVV